MCSGEGKEKSETERNTGVGDLEGPGEIRREGRGGGSRDRAEISSWISLLEILPQFSENSISRACQGRRNPPPRDRMGRQRDTEVGRSQLLSQGHSQLWRSPCFWPQSALLSTETVRSRQLRGGFMTSLFKENTSVSTTEGSHGPLVSKIATSSPKALKWKSCPQLTPLTR